MTDLPLKFAAPVTLAGGGALEPSMLEEARLHAPHLVAADGAADRLMGFRLTPEAVIGDLDSLKDQAALPATTRVIHLAEQESTDFEKCLYATEAPFYLAAGFNGRRVDHMLAVFHGMLRYPEKTVILIGEAEVMALVPPGRPLRLGLWPGALVSLFPL
ncbi:MAG: thiamine pyrophosphokinase, partial [Pseudomonadota bacterium]